MNFQAESHDSPSDFCFRVIDGPDIGKVYQLAEQIRVGRDPKADVFIGDFRVGRWQFILNWDEQLRCHFIDRGWFRPVFVNGRQVIEPERIPTRTGDQIAVANTTIVYEYLTNH